MAGAHEWQGHMNGRGSQAHGGRGGSSALVVAGPVGGTRLLGAGVAVAVAVACCQQGPGSRPGGRLPMQSGVAVANRTGVPCQAESHRHRTGPPQGTAGYNVRQDRYSAA